jgi:hypothetical protein
MAGHRHSHTHSHSHSHGGQDHEAIHVADPDNLLGAIIFVSYIIAALYFTLSIIIDISRLKFKTERNPNAKPSPLLTTLLTLLATISFTTLSYHMLNVLIQSYTQWTSTHGSVDTRTLMQGMLPSPSSLLSYLSKLLASLGQWTRTSTLFADFAHALLTNPGRRALVELSLLWSVGWSCWMSEQGHFDAVPGLWKYFVLAQILPTSFAQHLFLLVLTLQRSLSSRSPSTQSTGKEERRKSRLPFLGIFIVAAKILDTARDSLFWIATIRAIILTPYFVPRRVQISLSKTWTYVCYAGIVASTVLKVRTIEWDALRHALDEHPAVSALGYDFIIGVAGAVIYAVCVYLAGDNGRAGRTSGKDRVLSSKSGGEELQQKVDVNLRSGYGAASTAKGLQGRLDANLKSLAE